MAEPQLRIFINYRREDTWGEAMLLYDRLAGRFGSENVFLDVRSLQPAKDWLRQIKSQAVSSTVFLSLIGPRWLSIMKEHLQAVARPAQDYVWFEIEYALNPGSGICVMPVIVGDAVPFTGEGLPGALRALAQIEAELVRPARFEEDIAHLINTLETIPQDPPKKISGFQPALPRLSSDGGLIPEPSPVDLPFPPPKDATPPESRHYDLVLQHMVKRGNVVPFLGSRLSGRHAGPQEGSKTPVDADELAVALAEQFGVTSIRPDLPIIAQYVYLTIGRPDLYQTVRETLSADSRPGPVHRFLADFPRKLREDLHAEARYQLIVSTNFDTKLEQAFDEAGEPYDLAVYMASGQDKSKFVHFPYDGFPEPISIPNAYGKFPIGDYGQLERTVIVKIHGAVDRDTGDYPWTDNYVITEDHYIDYLSKSPIESLVPVQVLAKLRNSHCLFLGYTVREWNLRVFLQRIWRGEPLGAKSWAIEPDPDVLEKAFWASSNVDLYVEDPARYVGRLTERLAPRATR